MYALYSAWEIKAKKECYIFQKVARMHDVDG